MSVKDDQPTRAEILAPGDGPRIYDKEMMMELLRVSTSTYYKLLKLDFRGRALLRSSRLFPGGPRVHTQKQYDEYLEYLNTEGVIGSELLRQRRGRDEKR